MPDLLNPADSGRPPEKSPQKGPQTRQAASPPVEEAYLSWAADRSKENTGKLLTALQPSIDQGLRLYAGANPSSVDRSAAKRIALRAVETYTPGRGTAIRTHVNNHLQGLTRIRQKRNNLIPVPERQMQARTQIVRRREELTDELGREPSLTELADYTATPVPKIRRLLRLPQVSNSGFYDTVTEDAQSQDPAVKADDTDLIYRAVYADLGPIDQKVLEWTLGLDGNPPLANQEIARRLRVSPGAVSQRKALIQKQIDRMTTAGLFRK